MNHRGTLRGFWGPLRALPLLLFPALVACASTVDGAAPGEGDAPQTSARVSAASAVEPSIDGMDYESFLAPPGTAAIHARVFAQLVGDQPTLEELKETPSGEEIVAFIAEHALAMHDRLWAVRMMRELPSTSGRGLLLGWVTDEGAYPRLRCLSVRAMGAFNLVTDDEVRDAVMAASESDDACVREAAEALIGG